jgi:hypothetical protein
MTDEGARSQAEETQPDSRDAASAPEPHKTEPERDEAETGPSPEGDAPDVTVAAAAPAPKTGSHSPWAQRARAALGAWDRVLAFFASLAFAISFGLNFGVNNQVVYLLASIRVLDRSLLAKDWLTTETTHYHFTFKYLGALLMALSDKGWGVAVGLTVTITAGTMFLHELARSLVKDKRLALAAFFLTLTVAFVTRTKGPGATYAFDEILQPSTLGSVGLLAAIAFFAGGRWLSAGIALAVSGLFHANYLVLEIPAFGAALLVLGPRDLVKRGLRLLLPPLLVLLAFTPIILATAGGTDAVRAQEILQTIRAPHHYAVAGLERDFLPWIAWSMLGVSATMFLGVGRDTPSFRLAAALGGLSAVVWGGIVLATAFSMRSAVQLFSWRLEPHIELCFQLAVFAAVVQAASGQQRRSRAIAAPALALAACGMGVLFMVYGNRSKLAIPKLAGSFVAAGIVIAALVWAVGRVAPRARAGVVRALPWVLGAASLTGVFFSARADLAALKPRSSLLRGADQPTSELCAWADKHTSKEAQFLIPPDHESFRFRCKRPIVVDWKSNPIVPHEVLEWLQRLEDVSGRRIKNQRDLTGYSGLDEPKLKKLEAKYPIDFVVVRRGNERNFPTLKKLYSNRAYVVLAAH